jgi:hypothetical protein
MEVVQLYPNKKKKKKTKKKSQEMKPLVAYCPMVGVASSS